MPKNMLFRVSLQKKGTYEGAPPYYIYDSSCGFVLERARTVRGNERGNGGMIAGGLVFARTREII